MATCRTEESLFLTDELFQQIVNTHSDLQITGLTYSEQKEVVSFISNKMYRESLNPDAKYTIVDLKGYVAKTINKTVADNKKSIEGLTANEEDALAYKDDINALLKINTTLENVLDNLSKLVSLSQRHLSNLQGVTLVSENIPYEADQTIAHLYSVYSDVDAERTTFSDNFSLQVNSKDKIGGKLRTFLSFVKRKRFRRSGTTRDLKTFFGTEDYVPFNEVYDELHRLLEGVYPNYDMLIEKLEEKYEAAVDTRNNSIAWLGDLITQLKDPNVTDNTIQRMFVRDMAKHKANMEFINFKGWFNADNEYKTRLVVSQDNSSTAGVRLLKSWATSHTKSNVVTANGEYDTEKVKNLLIKLNPLKNKNTYEKSDAKLAIRHALEDIGIDVPEVFIDAVVEDKITIYGSEDYNTGYKFIRALERELLTMEGKVDKAEITSSFFKGVANAASTFIEDEFGNVFRVSDKLVYTYTNNHHLYNRIRDLKNNKNGILQKMENASFSEYSLYRTLLAEDTEDNFSDWFDMSYVSLSPLLKKTKSGYRRSKGYTTLPDVDLEVAKIGYTFRNNHKYNKTFDGVDILVSKGTNILPTISDKTKAVTMKGYTFHVTNYSPATAEANKELPVENRTDPFTVKKKAVNLYYKSVVQSEISRILESSNQDFLNNLDLTTEGVKPSYKGDMFYMTPYLNDLYLDDAGNAVEEGTEGAKSFIDRIIDNDDYRNAEQTIKDAIAADLQEKALERYNEWEDLGLVEEGLLKYKNEAFSYGSSIFKNGALRAKEAAIDITFSEEFNNANIFQLVIGDPAQFYKRDVQGTNGNITKRLAALVAPGEEADYSDMPHYTQVFLNDRISTSRTIEVIMKELDNVDYKKQYLKWKGQVEKWYLENPTIGDPPKEILNLETKIANLKSLAYTDIESTDAQEYVTWKTHIDEMLRYGELTDEEYDSIKEKLSNDKDLKGKELKKVLGPRKPVYANTEMQNVGAGRYFYRNTYVKSSTFPLLPQLVRKLQLEKFADKLNALENSKGHSVRAAYLTAVKVGFPRTGVDLFDVDGNVNENIDLESHSRELESRGLRIQQSVPYKSYKRNIKKGSQEAKLIFSGLLDTAFDFEGSKVLGSELMSSYNETYKKLYELGYQELQNFIMTPADENGNRTLDNNKLSRLLLKELDSREEYSKPMRDGLQVNEDGEFLLPLWESDYADEYMALINSIVDKFILTREMPGGSFVLGSEEGFLEWEKGGKEKAANTAGIIYAENYDPTVGLQGQRPDADGNIQPAQILLPMKFRDDKGNLIEASTLVDPETGRINPALLPDELRENFTFRIPTQLQQSMAYVEVVGFLPTAMGDLVIAPKDFVTQMGSDFDVDTLKAYMFNAIYKNGKLTKVPSNSKTKGGLQNRIMDIHRAVMLNPKAQAHIKTPLDLNAKNFIKIGKFVEGTEEGRRSKVDSVISHRYNKKKLNDGNAGNDGIAIFSSDSILNTLAQGKGLIVSRKILTEGVDNIMYPKRDDITVTFGNTYESSNGAIGLTESLKKGSTKSPSDMISATQTLSVDNAVLEAMSKINMNTETADVYTLLHMLGFEEDITANFMSQPILFDYVRMLKNTRGMFSEYDPNAKETIIKVLTQKYDPNNQYVGEDITLADFKGKNAAEQMASMIEKREDYGSDYGRTQLAILEKYFYFKEYTNNITSLKPLLNIDSKGLDKNFYGSNRKLNVAQKLTKHPIINAERLLYDLKGKANTLAGYDVQYGLEFLIDTFGDMFIETDPKFNFDKIVATLERTVERPLTDNEIYDIRNNIVHYMHSYLKNRDTSMLRDMLFYDTEEGSFYNNLIKLKDSNYGRANHFLKNIAIEKEDDGPLIINYDRVSGDRFDDSGIYMDLVTMLSNNIETEDGINPSHVAQQLMYYSLIKGGRKGTSFKKYIPALVLKDIVEVPEVFDENIFIEQYLQNNPEFVNTYVDSDVSLTEGGLYTLNSDKFPAGITIDKGEKLLLRVNNTDLYKEVPTYPGNDITVYTGIPDTKQPDAINSYENTQQNAGDLSTTINLNDINNLTELYVAVTPAELPSASKLLFETLSKIPTKHISVKTRNLGPGINAAYQDRSIILNKDMLHSDEMNDVEMVNSIMHEHMHDLTIDPITRYFTERSTVSKPVAESLDRIEEFRDAHITAILSDDSTSMDFVNFLTLEYSTLSLPTLKQIKRATVNSQIRTILDDAITNKETGSSFDDTTIDRLYKSYDKIQQEGNFKYYYALSSVFEFVAVTPTEMDELAHKLNRQTYQSVIVQFFADLLASLGIGTNMTTLLNDIYTVASLPVQSAQQAVDVSRSVMYNTKAVSYDMDKKAFMCCDNIKIADKTNEPQLFVELTRSLYTKYHDKNLDWYDMDVSTVLNEVSLSANMDVPPVPGVYALSVLEKTEQTEEVVAAIDFLRKKMQLDPPKTEVPVVTEENLIKNTNDRAEPKNKYSDNSKLDAYIQKVSKYATGARGYNNISQELNKAEELGELTNEVEFKSLKSLGKDLIKKCGGALRTGNRWTSINARPAYTAKKGLMVAKKPHVGRRNKWELAEMKSNKDYKYGAYTKPNRGLSNNKWTTVTKLEGPSHAQGGIDLSINNGNVTLMKGQTQLKAKYGLFITADGPVVPGVVNPEINKEPQVIEKKTVVTKPKRKRYVKRKNKKS